MDQTCAFRSALLPLTDYPDKPGNDVLELERICDAFFIFFGISNAMSGYERVASARVGFAEDLVGVKIKDSVILDS